jgi:hypothetical protein
MKKWQEWKFLVTFLYLHIISEFFDFPKKWRFFFLTDQNASFMKKNIYHEMVLCSAHVGSASVWDHIYLYLRTKICFLKKLYPT